MKKHKPAEAKKKRSVRALTATEVAFIPPCLELLNRDLDGKFASLDELLEEAEPSAELYGEYAGMPAARILSRLTVTRQIADSGEELSLPPKYDMETLSLIKQAVRAKDSSLFHNLAVMIEAVRKGKTIARLSPRKLKGAPKRKAGRKGKDYDLATTFPLALASLLRQRFSEATESRWKALGNAQQPLAITRKELQDQIARLRKIGGLQNPSPISGEEMTRWLSRLDQLLGFNFRRYLAESPVEGNCANT